MSVHATAIVDPRAELAADVEIGPYAVVGAGVTLGVGVRVGAHAVLEGPTTVGAGTRIFPFASIGSDAQDLKYRGEPASLVIGARNIFREHVTVNRGTAAGGGVTRIGDDNLFMAGSHVAHDCTVGNGVVFANAAALAGHVVVQDRAVLGGFAGVHQHTRVGRGSMVGAGAMTAQDVPPFTICQGDRARLFGLNVVGLRRSGVSFESLTALKGAYREIFHGGRPLRIALEQVRERWPNVPEVLELADFCEGSVRGLCRSAGLDAPAQE